MRKGNYVECEEYGVIKITEFVFSVLHSVGKGIANSDRLLITLKHKFIPLTKEWLVDKFGFEKKGVYYIKSYTINGKTYEFVIWVSVLGNFYLNINDLEVKYVHKLQNIFNALSGQELDILK